MSGRRAAQLDEDGVLHTTRGEQVPRLDLTVDHLLDRSIAVYGASGTGKTHIMKHFMALLDGPIEEIVVVSPNEPSNKSYKGFVHPQLILYRPYLPDPANPQKDDGAKGVARFFNTLWKRQEMKMAIYQRANNVDVLSRLFRRLSASARREGQAHIQAINARRKQVLAQLRAEHEADHAAYAERKLGVNDKFKTLLALIYKRYLVPHYEALWARDDIDEDEAYCLAYLKFNPRLLLFLDDCAAQLKGVMTKEFFRNLFYQNRHAGLTVVFAFQDDTDLAANLRKNAFISFFTEKIVCLSNFDRQANKFPKPTRDYVAGVAADVFVGNRKLAYIRDDKTGQQFYHATLPSHAPKLFGSEALGELVEAVRADGAAMDQNNPFFNHFRLD